MEINHVIIQAGGKGVRLGHHTRNKPKCLVEVNGKTLLQRQLELYHDKKITIIADYKINILRSYIDAFLSEYDISIVDASDGFGTISGLRKSVENYNENVPFLLVWSDLIFDKRITESKGDVQVFVTDNFPCRYYMSDNLDIIKEKTSQNGILGAFTFRCKSVLKSLPESGSLVGEWMKTNEEEQKFVRTKIDFVREVGEFHHLQEEKPTVTSRFFNKISINNGLVTKECIVDEYRNVIEDEKGWYKVVSSLGFSDIPKIVSYEPFVMEYIDGTQGHKSRDKWDAEEKKEILENICETLSRLHSLKKVKPNKNDLEDMYLKKTLDRVQKISSLLPFYEEDTIIINDEEYQNPFSKNNKNNFCEKIKEIDSSEFCTIHGDPTFNNFLIKNDKSIVLYDPRGSFSSTKVYGDPNYDWAKLFYSIVGNYDSVNDKNFDIGCENNVVNYSLQSNGWEFLEDYFYKKSQTDPNNIRIITCLIWFSLCGYVRDYDSILMSYIRGVELWKKVQ